MKETRHSPESMLQDTILVLKQRQGASLAEIRKRLEQNFDGELSEAKNIILTSTLKGLVRKRKILKIGGKYKLARAPSVKADDRAVSRRRPAVAVGQLKPCRQNRKMRCRKVQRHRRRRGKSRRRPHSRKHRSKPHRKLGRRKSRHQ